MINYSRSIKAIMHIIIPEYNCSFFMQISHMYFFPTLFSFKL